MSADKFCTYHPNAKAIAVCERCAIDLCGMCGVFDSDTVFCESCSEKQEAENFVSSQSEKLERPATTLVLDESDSNEFTPPTGRKASTATVQWIVITICVAIITVQLYFYNNPSTDRLDPAALAKEQQLNSLVQCMLLFREIGLTLQEGRMPSGDMLCADSSAANIVRNEEGNIRYYHPNPQYYGYEEISVSGNDPEPNIVRLDSASTVQTK